MATNRDIDITEFRAYHIDLTLCDQADPPNVQCVAWPVLTNSLFISGKVRDPASSGGAKPVYVQSYTLNPLEYMPCLSDIDLPGGSQYTELSFNRNRFLNVDRRDAGVYRINIPFGDEPDAQDYWKWAEAQRTMYGTGEGPWCAYPRCWSYVVQSVDNGNTPTQVVFMSGYINLLATPGDPNQPPDPPKPCDVSVT